MFTESGELVLSSDGFHIESHIDSVPALARVKDLHGGLSDLTPVW